MKNLANIHFFVSIALVCFIANPSAHGYRPFDSTDAGVVDEAELEIELGFFKFTRDDGVDRIVSPSLVLNYGLSPKWEVVAEFDLQVYEEDEEKDTEILDPALFLKLLLKEGILQDKAGPSLALEFGVLFPSTAPEDKKIGFEGIGILSNKLGPFDYHFNLGLEFDREERNANLLWGVIVEYPLAENFMAGIELNGAVKEQGSPETSGLLGLVWDLGRAGLDLGIRRGLSETAPAWEVTAGMTISFSH